MTIGCFSTNPLHTFESLSEINDLNDPRLHHESRETREVERLLRRSNASAVTHAALSFVGCFSANSMYAYESGRKLESYDDPGLKREVEKHKAAERRLRRLDRSGFVYCFKIEGEAPYDSRVTGYYKIGRTGDLEGRKKQTLGAPRNGTNLLDETA
ncbi:hypothetical protein AAF712_009965 [Marasmius tenuissimus]|uniref:Uncharacterized protein n=1 Tax=Marasmius tenuissimus TaxID=585030 RepID=A0ABR2ZND2_9AGAR